MPYNSIKTMPIHTVQQGDQLSSITEKYGFRKTDTIWDDGANAGLKAKREDGHILFPGDELFIPEKTRKTENRPTGDTHVFRVPVQKLKLKLALLDVNSKPRAKVDCTLTVEGQTFSLRTGDDGTLEKEIPKTARKGKLLLPDMEIPLLIGHLDPVEEQSGQMARLNNLGYEAGDVGKPDADRFKSAVEEFQCDQEMDVTGDCDGATQAKLKSVHGC